MNIDIESESKRPTEEVERQCEKLRAYIAALPVLAPVLSSITFDYCYLYPAQAQIICRVRTRADFAPIRALLRGKWEKRISEDNGILTARYQAVIDCGIQVTCHVCELPPSCKIIETSVDVPEHTEVKREAVCTETRELAGA